VLVGNNNVHNNKLTKQLRRKLFVT